MSAAQDCYDEANHLPDAYAQGASAWEGWGRQLCFDQAVTRKVMEVRISLGGNADFRTGFKEAAEAEGFTIQAVVLTVIPLVVSLTDFDVQWSNP